jgi:dihydroorotase
MMDRRQFVTTGAAGAALFGRVRTAHAAAYDLIIRGGRVIDPSTGLDAVRDVAIVQGKIAAVGVDIPGDAARSSSR